MPEAVNKAADNKSLFIAAPLLLVIRYCVYPTSWTGNIGNNSQIIHEANLFDTAYGMQRDEYLLCAYKKQYKTISYK
ncbi:MAG: hypothetical protein Kow0083_02600 [Methylophaga sp.]